MEFLRGAAWLVAALLVLAATGEGQDCICENNKRTTQCVLAGGKCQCLSYGTNTTVDCATLTSKCLLMKAEVLGTRSGRRERPKTAYVNNDGIYDPTCDDKGNFIAKQCNGTETCWCVNSAGVRRTEKGDKTITCNEVVRTSWIIMEMKHDDRNSPVDQATLQREIRTALSQRYKLDPTHIHVTYEDPYIIIDLKQNASEKAAANVDIADVAYYFEKDVKEDPIASGKLDIMVSGEPLRLKEAVIYYVDEKPPEFSMKRLTAGVIAVIVVVVLAIVAGILVLIFTRRKRGKYEKAEVKELNEISRERMS